MDNFGISRWGKTVKPSPASQAMFIIPIIPIIFIDIRKIDAKKLLYELKN